MKYDSRNRLPCQDPQTAEALSDKGRNGKERPWRAYKVANEYLAMAYDSLSSHKADRLRGCCRTLTFARSQSGEQKLVHADSCRVRLCPLCAWRRSLKNYWTTTKIVNWLSAHEQDPSVGRYSYLFVTLTVRNCKGPDLSTTIDTLFAAVKRLYQRKEIKASWKGMVRNMEVTHNVDYDSKDFDTFHPHFHCIVAVRPSYFSHGYISHERLVELWRDCLGVDYDPVVDIRRIRGRCGDRTTAGALAECSKYAAKAADYILLDDWDLTCDTVKLLDAALDGRRLINYGGIFREVKALLKLDDCEDGDLVKVGMDETSLGPDAQLVTFMWYSGYRQYYKRSQ